MTNQETMKKFIQGESGKSLNMTSTGDRLFSYQTVIAERIDNHIYINSTKYSPTTSKQTTQLTNELTEGYTETTKHAPRGTTSLVDYI